MSEVGGDFVEQNLVNTSEVGVWLHLFQRWIKIDYENGLKTKLYNIVYGTFKRTRHSIQ